VAQITKSIQAQHGLVANLVPEGVLKQIDQTELLDRVIYAEELGQRSRNATDPTLRNGYASLAQAVLRANPRAQVARQSAELMARAATLSHTSQADEFRRKAQELLEEHPPAPRRAESSEAAQAMRIAKEQGGEDDLTLIYTADGQPCGVVSASKITPVTAAEIAKMQEAGVVIIDAGMGPVNAGGTSGLPRCPVSFRLRKSCSSEVSRRLVSSS
jgi:hypothetical protein